MLRHDWALEELRTIYTQPLPNLIYQAQNIHRRYFDPTAVQRSTLVSVKTGGCPEDCHYCPQSAHYQTDIARHGIMPKEEVLKHAEQARASGSSRICMGAAWREVKDGHDFDKIIEMVESVAATGLQVCCTLGMLSFEQAKRLKAAGCHSYNHNLDTSPEFYGEIISTRTYAERLETLRNVRRAGISVCCGGIIGMGEGLHDRLKLVQELSRQEPHPESVPINMLVRVEGTPLAKAPEVNPFDLVRLIALSRVVMPRAMVRLSAGRTQMSAELQALCFMAGANSVFSGDKLLTTPNVGDDYDNKLLQELGMHFAPVNPKEEEAAQVCNA